MTSLRLIPPALDWTAEGAPRSRGFDDIYYAPEAGFAETRHVFLDGIGAPEVWAGRARFTLGETGFGTGLNFLAAWDLWRRTAAADARLDYLAVEAYPLQRDDLRRALALWPELQPLADQLIAAWPHGVAGSHLLSLDGGRVRLLLLFGDAASMLAATEAQVDAWFLDGFAPSKNPDMWSPALFAAVARLSKPGARLATFTVAGVVRRGLAATGFTCEKRPGFGTKRGCLAARFEGPAPVVKDATPWFAPPVAVPVRRIAVIGGGIAGLTMARVLMSRGVAVTLYEKAGSLLPEASGNPVAVLEPWIDLGEAPAGRFSLAATLHALRWYRDYAGDGFEPCGVLAQEDRAWQERVAAGGYLPPEDVSLQADGLLFPRAGMIHTARLAMRLADGVDLRLGQDIARLEDLDADAVVLAASFGSEALGGFPLSLAVRRGQVSLLEGGAPLGQVLSGKGYVTPVFVTPEGLRHLAGASFAAADPSTEDWRALAEADQQANLEIFQNLLPGSPARLVGGRTGLRAASVDHLPIMGALPVADYAADYGGLAHGRRGDYPQARYQPGRYVLTGLGARGYLTAPLLAETLAAQILGAPVPLPRSLLDALHPGRAAIRAIRRAKKTG
ncbi:bifunctional tRNA (5-methylaminomethyl-2-thiouridine)(34)-methyltransferase MnmD/FAD-dependent 5-carboxymethylaminomethyl-2-thiouridine(34) oxidoreductase MnmC [Govanella unica]|uniref:tRNA 5-methylaminomethyl-2-thiouridine biosynthesis bifunctional protein MnmC n=1 Tax=Govanella unica TaxID=2975056 RepID=A0A9X3TYT2_9PROT|nr:bifunctional tRNA (5-methylaminomethyl-2-thiouridine)(34)-methyltransferase MnmD/FAD-dependent 5-carboxymethylaminomethyl-2-thiouridine(34) oxidoreductase MnmC [Govania unica]MDA5194466.1 bifunctional tRNA (5-methylaminomethyl-2-thiouridine)(34)-methyltransferase MnmD/FAD-dependent 5-carboxymethylaminomethyl-2-thiouridine(34) oxidoreductase MnmC [Govania unica]